MLGRKSSTQKKRQNISPLDRKTQGSTGVITARSGTWQARIIMGSEKFLTVEEFERMERQGQLSSRINSEELQIVFEHDGYFYYGTDKDGNHLYVGDKINSYPEVGRFVGDVRVLFPETEAGSPFKEIQQVWDGKSWKKVESIVKKVMSSEYKYYV